MKGIKINTETKEEALASINSINKLIEKAKLIGIL